MLGAVGSQGRQFLGDSYCPGLAVCCASVGTGGGSRGTGPKSGVHMGTVKLGSGVGVPGHWRRCTQGPADPAKVGPACAHLGSLAMLLR